jgi:hypothetical protein
MGVQIMKALVEASGRVAQVVADDQSFPVHPSLQWVDCDDTIISDQHNYINGVFVIEPQPALTWADIRSERDGLLAATDWQAGTDVTMTDAQKAYRQALRDIPQTFANPEDVVWPTKP